MKSFFRQFFLFACLIGIGLAGVDYTLDFVTDHALLKSEMDADADGKDEAPLTEKEEALKEPCDLFFSLSSHHFLIMIADAAFYFSDTHPGDHPVADVPTPPPDRA